jgi:hypothetical protein
MITLLDDPARVVQVSPEIISRWLATESPNNFQLQRKDYVVGSCASSGGSPATLQLTLTTDFEGDVGDTVAVYNAADGQMYVGLVTAVASPPTTITTDIAWQVGFNATYMNDNTLRDGYYFEGRLTVNGVLQTLTIVASPDVWGIANLDISGVLRIMVSLGKTADYTADLAAEPLKSGSFTFEYRECWFGYEGTYTAEGNTWYYAEAVRSAEQGSNLYDFVATAAGDAPFFNAFDQPVYFVGLPFDISFIMPVQNGASPAAQALVTINRYNASNVLLATSTTLTDITALEGRVCSLLIEAATIEADAAYLTVQIDIV